MVRQASTFEGIYSTNKPEYPDFGGAGGPAVDMSGDSKYGTKSGNIMPSSNTELDSTTTVVSDANASDPRQLLHAHVYNYLVKNGHYATARQFLKEADLPLDNKNANEIINNSVNTNINNDNEDQQLPPGLLPTRLQVDSEETLLFEWWNSLCRLHDHVEQTPVEELRSTPQKVPTPFLPRVRQPFTEDQQDNVGASVSK
ncbi:hypothetical protein ZYGR_0A03260 [Zygosaccharomyces rouxii]|uniref:ZYRO0A07392p n=2 Tax=Zygosaccharomyces rouxii TaxID=4956 RepID=C5DPZ6_ZYGRC|nr:uncharacterized protein ZYRO0A07392g [Zygosaccharomyces rouxii]KAH9198722.1 hypothetical protein LQ764DRAFT_140063 [Zygosaccharomyces rouxii]GAV46731.1 hypothetical protein ZYGR_0A03260 [Zygosaccharomyces rouxii]CAR25757.1 ZYRO0A07392p [Zygosaccharomyces rouxii]